MSNICLGCGEDATDRSAITDNVIYGSRLSPPSAVLHVASNGYVHLHDWVLYPKEEDLFRRHLGRAIRSRLPVKVLRAEVRLQNAYIALREKW